MILPMTDEGAFDLGLHFHRLVKPKDPKSQKSSAPSSVVGKASAATFPQGKALRALCRCNNQPIHTNQKNADLVHWPPQGRVLRAPYRCNNVFVPL